MRTQKIRRWAKRSPAALNSSTNRGSINRSRTSAVVRLVDRRNAQYRVSPISSTARTRGTAIDPEIVRSPTEDIEPRTILGLFYILIGAGALGGAIRLLLELL